MITLLLLVRAANSLIVDSLCYSSCTSRSWWIAFSMQHQLRGCNNSPSFLCCTVPNARFFVKVV